MTSCRTLSAIWVALAATVVAAAPMTLTTVDVAAAQEAFAALRALVSAASSGDEPEVKRDQTFLSSSKRYAAELRSNGFAVRRSADAEAIEVTFVGAQARLPSIREASSDRTVFIDAYPGIDVVYRRASSGGELEFDFVVEPGADANVINLAASAGARFEPAAGGEQELVHQPSVRGQRRLRRSALHARRARRRAIHP